MNQTSQAPNPLSLGGVFQDILGTLGRVVERLRRGDDAGDELSALQEMLESLPLSSDEFSTACQRLRNAQRYLRARERGAARWELNALIGDLGGGLLTRQATLNENCRE